MVYILLNIIIYKWINYKILHLFVNCTELFIFADSNKTMK